MRCLCDNDAVIIILWSGTSKYPLVMHLMRCLYQLYMDGIHLPGTRNEAADTLSRDYLCLFIQLTLGVQNMATDIPDSLMHSLVHMDGRASFYFAQGLAASTIKTYQSGVNQFQKYCHSLIITGMVLHHKLFCVVLCLLWLMKASNTVLLRPTCLE